MSKVDQLTELRAAGFDVPRTIAVAGRGDLVAAACKLRAQASTTRAARAWACGASTAMASSRRTSGH